MSYKVTPAADGDSATDSADDIEEQAADGDTATDSADEMEEQAADGDSATDSTKETEQQVADEDSTTDSTKEIEEQAADWDSATDSTDEIEKQAADGYSATDSADEMDEQATNGDTATDSADEMDEQATNEDTATDSADEMEEQATNGDTATDSADEMEEQAADGDNATDSTKQTEQQVADEDSATDSTKEIEEQAADGDSATDATKETEQQAADGDSATDSTKETEEQTLPPRVYIISIDSLRECFHRIPEEDLNTLFLELCFTIPLNKLLHLLSNRKGLHIISELDLANSLSNIPRDLQSEVVFEIVQQQKQEIKEDCQSFAQMYKNLDTLQSFNPEEWFSHRNFVLKSVVNALASHEKNYFQRCLALEHLYNLQGFSFVSPCSFMTNISLLAISNSKLTVNLFSKALPGGSYTTLKAWTRDLASEPMSFPSGDCMVAIDNDQIVQRKWKVKVGQKSRVSVVTSVCQAEVNPEGTSQKRGDLAPR